MDSVIRIRRGHTGTAPVSTEIELAGKKIAVELIPCPSDEFLKDIKTFRKIKMVHNPVSRQMERLEYLDDDDEKYKPIADDKLDKHLVNFHGVIDDATGKELDGSVRENKLLFGSILIEDTEEVSIVDEEGAKGTVKKPRKRLVRAIIFEKIQELATASIKAQEKN